jgi:hypothetical protein
MGNCFFFKFPKFPLLDSPALFFFGLPSGENSPQKQPQLGILEELAEVLPNLNGISQRGALSQYQVNNYPKCMVSMTIHLPHSYESKNLKELGEVFLNVGKFLRFWKNRWFQV